MDVEIRILESFLARAIVTSGDPVHSYRGAKLVRFLKERFEKRIVEISCADGSRYDDADKSEIFQSPAQFFGRLLRFLQRHGGDAADPSVKRLAFFSSIVVVSATHGGR